MKNLLLLTLVAISTTSFTPNTKQIKADDRVDGILFGVQEIIDSSRRGRYYRPGRTFYPPSRTVHVQPRTYVFGARSHTGTLAIQLKDLANSMCLEAYAHYRHNRAFKAVYRDMYRVLTDSKHLIELTNNHHGHEDEDHIAEDLYNLDKLFHQIEGGVRGWSSDNRHHHNLPGQMAAVEDVIHHLMKDYGVKSKIGQGNIPVPVPGNGPPANNGFGARAHIQKLAMELNRKSANMCLVAHGHYRNNPAFNAVYKDMYKLMKESQHILDLANRNSNDDHIAADLNDIDQLFHRIENGVKNWRSNNRFHADLPQAIESTEDTIHHLMEDFGVKSQIGGTVPVPTSGNNNLPVPPPAGNGNPTPFLAPAGN